MSAWLRSAWTELLLSGLVAAVEVAAIAPWLHLLAGWLGHPDAAIPAPPGTALAGLLGFWAARGFLAGGWDLAAARLLSLGLWLALVIVWLGLAGAGIGAPLALIDGLLGRAGAVYALLAVAGLAWWRGMALGAQPEPFPPSAARSLLERGVARLAAALILATAVGGAAGRHALDAAATAVPVVLLGGLVAVATAQERTVRARTRARGVGWIGAGAALAAGIVLLALLLAGVAGPEVWRQVLWPVGLLLGAVATGLIWVLTAIVWVLFLALTPLVRLMRALLGGDSQPPAAAPLAPPPLPEFQQEAQRALPPFLGTALEVLLVAGALALGVWLALRALRRFRSAATDRALDEVRESVWSRELALAQLRGWLRGLEARRGGASRGPYDLARPPATVREAYRHLLVLAGRAGLPRQPAESPSDYAARVGGLVHEAADPLADLTGRYHAARYGERETPADAARARADWEALRAALAPRRRGEGA
ncbi:MAG: DUF4129 domain-containing protein [Sphaerobacter sp.]|nr:DUF4129 domain-containing protein [Sphaerobacter sp.]